MSYEWAVKGGNDTDGWAVDPKVVVVAVGSHDCSRLVQALRHGNSEQYALGEKIARSLNRSPLGRMVTVLLKRHGGEDLTEFPEPEYEYGIRWTQPGYDSEITEQHLTIGEAERTYERVICDPYDSKVEIVRRPVGDWEVCE